MSSTTTDPIERKVTTRGLRRMKESGQRIAALTAYDHLMAGLLDDAGVDVILVGDSVATVVQGLETTVAYEAIENGRVLGLNEYLKDD